MVTNFDENRCPNGLKNLSKSSHWVPPWSRFLRFCEEGRKERRKEGRKNILCVLGPAKSRPTIAMINDFGRQIDSSCLFLEGSAGEAVCRGRERVGVMLPESIQLRVQHAAPRVTADLKATASAADP